MLRTFNVGVGIALLALAGCGPADGRKPVFPVEGRLTFNQQPMAGATIVFHPLGESGPQAVRAQATADDDGRYRLTTYLKDDGAPAGDYAVTIYWPGKKTKASPPGEEEDLAPDRLKMAYSNPATTKLRATVRTQPTTHDISLP